MQYTLPITQPSLHGIVHVHIYIIETMDSFIWHSDIANRIHPFKHLDKSRDWDLITAM